MAPSYDAPMGSDDRTLVHRLTSLPRKILHHHEVEGLAELILHELGHESAFGLKRATYLVDNPDFDHLVGVAGFCKNECKFHQKDLWQDPHAFRKDMMQAPFRSLIKKLLKTSLHRREIDLEKSSDILELGKMMGMEKPHYLSWNLRHGNHGLFIFEKEKEIDEWQNNLLTNVASLLGLCSI